MRASGAHALSRVGREGCPKISCVSCSHGCENWTIKKAAAKSLQLCPTLCHPIDGSPAGSPVPGILQARTLEWLAISFPNAWKWKVKVKSLSCVRLFATPWTAAYQAPPSMGFSRWEYWSGVPLPSPKEGRAPKELMVLNCGVEEDSWESLGQQGDQTSHPKGNRPWIFTGRTDADAEAQILWPSDAKSRFTEKDPDSGKDGRKEEKRVTEDEMVV